mmetsp:Transcript_30517/g.93320  ORF Transcript_30517/g.93320 Transcript_30517/m.93320 type:complete len:407 (-) Transcript_30517:160-1380(-)|eukprot:scaffold293773_cov43-Tisochrysis_lutea.AAC.1
MASEATGYRLPPAPRQLSYRIEKLNPLALPKNVSLTCELTGRPALVVLVAPQLSLHFASREIAMQAWDGILAKISHILGSTLAPPANVGSQMEREDRAREVHACQVALVALCNEEASRHIVQGHYDLAIPAATYSLRFATTAYGEGKLQLVPAYLYLAEAYLGNAQYRKAEEYLTLANWALLKTSGASNALRSQLRRNFGKLYAAQGRYDDALRQLADDIYYSSLRVGPEHIDTSGGYYQLANVFYAMNKIESALAMYDKVVDIWYRCLAALLGNDSAHPLSEAKGHAGVEMLKVILKRREECAGETYIATGEAHYILGLLHQYCGDPKSAQKHIRTALGIYENQLGPEHHSTKDVARSLAQIEGSSYEGSNASEMPPGEHTPEPELELDPLPGDSAPAADSEDIL